MLETFRSIIQFRQHIRSIHAHSDTALYTCTLSHTHRFSCYGVCMLFACSYHMCVSCAERHCDPNSQQSFLRSDVHYALTKGTASVRGPVQPETGSDNLSGTRLHAAAVPASWRFLKGFQHMFEFPLNNFKRCNRCDIHETCRRPWKLSAY